MTNHHRRGYDLGEHLLETPMAAALVEAFCQRPNTTSNSAALAEAGVFTGDAAQAAAFEAFAGGLLEAVENCRYGLTAVASSAEGAVAEKVSVAT